MCWHMLSSERATDDACGIARHLGKAFVNMSAKPAPLLFIMGQCRKKDAG